MTKKELREISQEIDNISKKISLLDPENVIENQLRERLFHRWDFLDYQLDQALISVRKNTFCIMNESNTSADTSVSHDQLTSQLEKGNHNKQTDAKYKLRIVH